MMVYEKQLNFLSKRIDGELRRVLDEKIRGEKHSLPFAEEVYRFIKDYVLRRGKRLASSCTIMAFRGVKGRDDERILRAATSIEFFRHSILAHDDLVDEDEFRRGEPSVHASFRELHRERFGSEGSERFGNSMAIFIGNVLISLAYETLCSAGFDNHLTERCLLLLARNFRWVNDSQVLDLLFEFYEPTEEEWFAMARTRAPTLFETSILLGAILAGASEDQMEALREYAWNIGYAFDIQDDIIGSFASEEEYGRPPVGDIALGKKTLFVIKALEKATGEDGFFLRRVLGKRGADRGEIERFMEVVVKTGALEEARLKSRELAEEAVRALKVAGLSEEAEGFFAGLSDFIVESTEWYT